MSVEMVTRARTHTHTHTQWKEGVSAAAVLWVEGSWPAG